MLHKKHQTPTLPLEVPFYKKQNSYRLYIDSDGVEFTQG